MANPGKMSTDEPLWLAGLHVLQCAVQTMDRVNNVPLMNSLIISVVSVHFLLN